MPKDSEKNYPDRLIGGRRDNNGQKNRIFEKQGGNQSFNRRAQLNQNSKETVQR